MRPATRLRDGAAPEAVDLLAESRESLDRDGDEEAKPWSAKNCSLTQRLVERGVRFIELFHEAWDKHGGIMTKPPNNCRDADQAYAALIKDLKQPGLLQELGFDVADAPVHVHDRRATILHPMGFDHKRLRHRLQSRDSRLTDVHGEIAYEFLP